MIPSFKHGIIASSRPRVAAAGGADVTPNAVNWANVTYDGLLGDYSYTERQITGINQTITIRVTNDQATDGVYYYVSNTQGDIVNGDGTSQSDPGFLGMTYLPHNSTFNVSNNQYVTFSGNGQITTLINTVVNTSDANTTLDTFTYTCQRCD